MKIAVKYLSPATSTFILRISRANYRIAWAALSFMNEVPVKDGKKCVFRVVRVSGTIRKVEEEAIRRARDIMLRARREGGASEEILDTMLGKKRGETSAGEDAFMVDRGDDEDDYSDGDG
jgi:ribonuclease P/MRP protein subunit POP5